MPWDSILAETLFANDQKIFINEDFNNIKHFHGEMSILSTNLHETNCDDVDFDEDDIKLLIMSDLWLGVIEINYANQIKKI